MMELGRGFTCFVKTSNNWLQSDYDTLQLNNNYGTLVDNTIMSTRGISLANPTNIFKWKPDFSDFLGDPSTTVGLPTSAFAVFYIKDASGNYHNSGDPTAPANVTPPGVGVRGYGDVLDDNNYSGTNISLSGTGANGTPTAKSYLKFQIQHFGYKLNELDGYNSNFNDFLKVTHKNNGSIASTQQATWITSTLISGHNNTQTLEFENTHIGSPATYNGKHSKYQIINYIKLTPYGTGSGEYNWSTNDTIEIELQDAANGTYNIGNKIIVSFT